MSQLRVINPAQISVVLIPGFMLDETLWDDVVAALPSSWNIVRASLTQGETITEMAQAIAQQAPPQFILVGFSLGGYIARCIAEQFSERVTGLILIASSLRSDSAQQREHKLTAIRLNSKESFRGLSSISIIKTLHPRHANNKNIALIKTIQAMGKNLGYENFVKQSLLDRSHSDMQKINCPTLIIAGAEDQLRSIEEANELYQQIKHARLVTIKNTGHMIPLEQPEVLAGIMLRWVAGLV